MKSTVGPQPRALSPRDPFFATRCATMVILHFPSGPTVHCPLSAGAADVKWTWQLALHLDCSSDLHSCIWPLKGCLQAHLNRGACKRNIDRGACNRPLEGVLASAPLKGHAKLTQLSLLWCWPLPPGWRGPPVELALLQDRYGGWHRIDSRTAVCLRRLTHGATRGGG